MTDAARLRLRDLLCSKEVHPALISFAQKPPGKLALAAILAVPLYFFYFDILPAITLAMIAAATLCSFFPEERWKILSWATIGLFVFDPFWVGPRTPFYIASQEHVAADMNLVIFPYGIALVFVLFVWGLFYSRARFGSAFPFRRPVLSLLLLYLSLVILSSQHVLHGVPQVYLWSFTCMLSGYLWFLCYALTDKGAENMFLQFGVLRPLWCSSTVPVGKGITYLQKLEVKDAQEYAVVRVKAVKFVLLCAVLLGLDNLLVALAGHFGVPLIASTILMYIHGQPLPSAYCWASLVVSFVDTILHLTALGNGGIAAIRMMGFQLPRNTYKVWQSKTVVDFWNRFAYYFKELLVDFFFYPTFLKCFKNHRRVRIAFATFMATCVGNIIFHFTRDLFRVIGGGLWKTAVEFETYAIYCLLLSAGIIISQLRPRNPAPAGFLRGTLLPFLTVMAFFCLLQIFDTEWAPGYMIGYTPTLAFKFLLHLFGM